MLEAPERAAGVQDPPAYYNPPGGLLTYQPQLGNLVNESVITGDGMELEDYRGHFNLVNAQLTQVCHSPSILPSLQTLFIHLEQDILLRHTSCSLSSQHAGRRRTP